MSLNIAAPAATGGAGTAGAAGGAAAVAAAVDAPVPGTFPEKFALAKALRDDHASRFAKLRTAPPAKQYATYVESVNKKHAIELKVTEVVKETPIAELLAAWRGPIALTPIADTFHDKLDYGADDWTKLEALNAGMVDAMDKWEMLQQDNARVVAATTAFVTNYRAIGTVLDAMELLAAGGVSTLEVTKARFVELSARITAAAAEAGATIGPAPAPIKLPGITPAHEAFLKESLRASGVAAPRFELLYQASVDGVTVADVLRACAGKGPVLVVGREATDGWLFGGFMDCGIADGTGQAIAAPQAFVFTLTNPAGLSPTAWRRGDQPTGVYRHTRYYCFHWHGMLWPDTSVLSWSIGPSPGYYAPLAPHTDKVFTGSTTWEASDILIYRV